MAYSGIQNRKKFHGIGEIAVLLLLLLLYYYYTGTYRPEQLLAVLTIKMPPSRADVYVCEVSAADAMHIVCIR